MAEIYSDLADEKSTKPVGCGNCGWTGEENGTLPIRNLPDRIAPGEIVPVGECPECGALCHYTNGEL